MRRPSFTCPLCLMTSYHPSDIREGYCGNCHDWTSLATRVFDDERGDAETEADA